MTNQLQKGGVMKKLYCYLLAVVLMTGCATSTRHPVQISPAQDILARIGDRVITVSEFEERFNALPARSRKGKTIEEQKEKFLEQLVEMTLFSVEARAQGIDKEKSIAAIIQDMVDNILARECYKREILDKISVTDDDVKEYYEAHPDEFKEPERIKARQILIKVEPNATQEVWAKAEAKAKKLKKQIDNGADFAKLAKEHSDDTLSRRWGRSLGYFTRENIPKGFPDTVFSLDVGDVIGPIKCAQGYRIIKVEAKKPEQIKAFNRVKGSLKRKLRQEKQKAVFDEVLARLKKKHKVIINKGLLSAVKVEPAKTAGG